MEALPRTAELERVARRLLWFEAPAKALADPVRLLAYAMTYGTHEDMHTLRRYLGDEDLREALDRAPPGIFDPRSWSYWHLVLDRWPPPPLPERKLP